MMGHNKEHSFAYHGEFMYVEMAHYTDDDTVTLICISSTANSDVHEFKLDQL